MVAAFAHSRAKIKSHAYICRIFATIQKEYRIFFAAFCNNTRNLDQPLYAGNKTAIETVNWIRKTGSKKGEKRSIRWESDGVSFLGRKRNLTH